MFAYLLQLDLVFSYVLSKLFRGLSYKLWPVQSNIQANKAIKGAS